MMNPSTVLLHKKALSSWVFADPRRWHLFCYLLLRADEKGYAEVSVRDYCRQYGQERSFVQRLLKNMEDEGICESIVSQKRTIIFLCNYARYNGSETESEPIMSQNAANNVNISADTERKKGSPHTPFKEEKENATTEVATLQKKEKEAAGAEISLSVEQAPLEERRQRFWADCCHCHARHPEWPGEAVKSFFLYWTQLTQDGRRFKFETEAAWGIGHRMKWYIVHGRWLDTAQEAKLERIRGGGGGRGRGAASTSELERRRAQAVNDEAQAAYDRYFAEKSKPQNLKTS